MSETAAALAQEVSSLFVLPDAARRVNELIGDPAASIQDVAEVMQLDAGLTAALLRLANSAYYGLPSKVESVSLAINLVGQNTLRDLVLSVSVTRTFTGIPEAFVDMPSFWDNSTTCGVLCRNLGRLCHIRDVDRLFIAGLLHGVGKLAFYAQRPAQYRPILEAEQGRESAITAAERRVFGFDHAQLGGELLKAWGLPEMLCDVVAHYPHPLGAGAHQRETAIVHVAHDMATHMSPLARNNHGRGEYQPGFDDAAWELLGADRQGLPGLMQTSLLQAVEVLEIINPRATLIY